MAAKAALCSGVKPRGGGSARSAGTQTNFLPRVKTPTLLVGGRYDFQFPLETAQKPMFALLGTPPEQKRHVILDGGHIPTRFNDAVKVMLEWADQWMGPVEQR